MLPASSNEQAFNLPVVVVGTAVPVSESIEQAPNTDIAAINAILNFNDFLP
jgi:hypothetical protein